MPRLLYGKAKREIREAPVGAEFEGWSLGVGVGIPSHIQKTKISRFMAGRAKSAVT